MFKKLLFICSSCLLGASFFTISAFAHDLKTTLQQTLKNSDAIGSARYSWIAARETIGTKNKTKEWSADGSVTGKHAETETSTSSGFSGSNTGTITVTLSKNIYDGGQAKENTAAERINLKIESANYSKTEQDVLLGAIRSHLAVIKAQKELVITQNNFERMVAHVEAAEIKASAGAATPTSLAQAESRLAKARSSLLLAKNALENASDDYMSLTGLDPTHLEAPKFDYALPASLGKAEEIGKKEHPEMLAARAKEALAAKSFDTLVASVRPSLSFDLSASDTFANGTSNDKTVFSAQLKFSTPLIVTPATRAKSRNLSAKLNSSKLNSRETARNLKLNIRKSFRSLETANETIRAVEAEVAASRLVAQGVSNEYEFGQKTMLDLQDAEQDLNDAELRLILAQHDLLVSSYEFQASIGRLTAENLGLGDVLGRLENISKPDSFLTGSFAFLGE